ncbi:helix-turn-helix domain-containing protein [Natronomonas sp. EA1]|uniref:helix-turn-helix domain-containing protein n=1 Tax=Natronomonas sp. EA1 TaxID=3421655 RepID=UPI003EC112F6
MYQAVFRVHGDGPYERATATGDTEIELWCNDHCDLLAVRGDSDEAVLDRIREAVGVRQEVAHGDDTLVITDACLRERLADPIEGYLADHGCLSLPPLRYVEGTKVVRVLALDPEALTAFYRDLATDVHVTVESKRRLTAATPSTPLLSLEAVLPRLSPRQHEVFTVAHERGYYDLPRGTTTAEIAEAVGVERRTAEHHLRRAEKKLADALVEYL